MKKLAPLRLGIAVALGVSSGCGDSTADDSSSAGAEFGCRDPEDEGFCTQYLLEDEGLVEDTQQSCALGGIREVIETCPTQEVAGCCVLETAQYVAHQCYYPPTTTQMVEDQCAELGQAFVAAP